MQAILSKYYNRTGTYIDYIIRNIPLTRDLLLQSRIRYQALKGFVYCGAGDKNTPIAAAVSKVYKSLYCLLIFKDKTIGNPPKDPQLLYFYTL